MHFDLRKHQLTPREIDFMLLCMHIKIEGHLFNSDEAFLLFSENGYKGSMYLYWNDRIYPKGWFTAKLFRQKGTADLTPLLGMRKGACPTKLVYKLEVSLDKKSRDEAKTRGYFRGLSY